MGKEAAVSTRNLMMGWSAGRLVCTKAEMTDIRMACVSSLLVLNSKAERSVRALRRTCTRSSIMPLTECPLRRTSSPLAVMETVWPTIHGPVRLLFRFIVAWIRFFVLRTTTKVV